MLLLQGASQDKTCANSTRVSAYSSTFVPVKQVKHAASAGCALGQDVRELDKSVEWIIRYASPSLRKLSHETQEGGGDFS